MGKKSLTFRGSSYLGRWGVGAPGHQFSMPALSLSPWSLSSPTFYSVWQLPWTGTKDKHQWPTPDSPVIHVTAEGL